MLLMMVMVREIRDLRIPSTRQTEMHDDSRYEAHTHTHNAVNHHYDGCECEEEPEP